LLVEHYLKGVRDGLKPVHRRVSICDSWNCRKWLGINRTKNRRVSSGDWNRVNIPRMVILLVNDTIVRWAQPFFMRLYPWSMVKVTSVSVDGRLVLQQCVFTRISVCEIAHHLLMVFRKRNRLILCLTMMALNLMPVGYAFLGVPGLLFKWFAGICVAWRLIFRLNNLVKLRWVSCCYRNADITIDELVWSYPRAWFPSGAFINGVPVFLKLYTGRWSALIYACPSSLLKTWKKAIRQFPSFFYRNLLSQLNKRKSVERDRRACKRGKNWKV